MEKEGWFYRGWWQVIPERHRPHIRINRNKVTEVDFVYRHGGSDAKVLGFNHKQLLKQIELTHESIFESLRSGAGLNAQLIESISSSLIFHSLGR